MVWNQPGSDRSGNKDQPGGSHQTDKNRQDRDPWGSSPYQDDRRAKETRNSAPPDLEEVFRDLGKKLRELMGDKGGKKPRGEATSSNGGSGKLIGVVALIVLFAVWALSGFYTVKEAERGVVTRFGKFSHLVSPGLNWRPPIIDKVYTVNVETVRELAAAGVMLTADENVVRVEMNVQYRVTDPERYLFSVTNPNGSLRQATDSALRGVIGRSTMDRVLTEGRTVVRSETQREIEETIKPYNMGLTVLDVNFQAARPPEEVKAAFDDAIAARENREQYVREAEAYSNEVQPRANGRAQRILEEARAYKARVVLEAEGEVARFVKVLPEYKKSPQVTKERLYIETMERILSQTRKVLINDKNNSLMVLPLEQLLTGSSSLKNLEHNSQSFINKSSGRTLSSPVDTTTPHDNIMDQRRSNALRDDTQREGRN